MTIAETTRLARPRLTVADVVQIVKQNAFPDYWLWFFPLAIYTIDAIWLLASPRLSLNLQPFRGLLPALFTFGILIWRAHTGLKTSGPVFQRLVSGGMMLIFIIFTFPSLGILNHLMMSIPLPLVDDVLARMDIAVGLNWLSYAKAIAAVPHLPFILDKFYSCLMGATLVVVLEAMVIGQLNRARELIGLTVTTASVTAAVSTFFPANGNMERYADAVTRKAYAADSGVFFIGQLTDLRGHGPVMLDITQLQGLSTFPSFHTTACVLLIYACRGNALRFVLGAIYGLVTIAATPVIGGHYFVDLLGGTALALGAIWFWRKHDRPPLGLS
jgi:hypothetical protein